MQLSLSLGGSHFFQVNLVVQSLSKMHKCIISDLHGKGLTYSQSFPEALIVSHSAVTTAKNSSAALAVHTEID